MKAISIYFFLIVLFANHCFRGYANEHLSRITVFNAGEDGVNVFRIPSLVTTKNGTLIVACEARKTSWQDKSPTDIAVKRSVDGGKTWSTLRYVTDGAKNNYAFMDPCLLADMETGKIFLFACRWPETPHDGTANVPFMMVSEDDGRTWSSPVSVIDDFTLSDGGFIHGFGPGSGIQLKGTKYNGRLIVPIRLKDTSYQRNRAVYSDDNGATWIIGNRAARHGEFQIAELPEDRLYYNCRMNGGRAAAYSIDGGKNWGNDIIDPTLPGITNGCQGSVLGMDSLLLYTGIEGAPAEGIYDDRCKLKLFTSNNLGVKWQHSEMLYEKAAGYSCITKLQDGSIAIIFEAGDEQGFIKSAIRPAGWMRLDVILLPPGYLGTSSNTTSQMVEKFFYISSDKNSIIFKQNLQERYFIFTAAGSLIKTGMMYNNQIDISDVNDGIYVLRIKDVTQKIVI